MNGTTPCGGRSWLKRFLLLSSKRSRRTESMRSGEKQGRENQARRKTSASPRPQAVCSPCTSTPTRHAASLKEGAQRHRERPDTTGSREKFASSRRLDGVVLHRHLEGYRTRDESIQYFQCLCCIRLHVLENGVLIQLVDLRESEYQLVHDGDGMAQSNERTFRKDFSAVPPSGNRPRASRLRSSPSTMASILRNTSSFARPSSPPSGVRGATCTRAR